MKDFIPLLVFVIVGPLVGGIVYLSCQKLCMWICKRRFVFGKRPLRNADDFIDALFNTIFFLGTCFIVGFLYVFFMEYVFFKFLA